MVKQKQKIDALGAYVAPITQSIDLRLEGCLCLSGGKAGDAGQAGAIWVLTEDYLDYGDL